MSSESDFYYTSEQTMELSNKFSEYLSEEISSFYAYNFIQLVLVSIYTHKVTPPGRLDCHTMACVCVCVCVCVCPLLNDRVFQPARREWSWWFISTTGSFSLTSPPESGATTLVSNYPCMFSIIATCDCMYYGHWVRFLLAQYYILIKFHKKASYSLGAQI